MMRRQGEYLAFLLSFVGNIRLVETRVRLLTGHILACNKAQ